MIFFKNKKGQYYLFAAMILIVSLFYIANNSSIHFDVSPYESFVLNYNDEAQSVMNTAILQNSNISNALQTYTELIIDFYEGEIGIVFIYSYDGNIYIHNNMGETIVVNNIDVEDVYQTTNHNINIIYDDETFVYTFIEEYNEFKSIISVQ